MFQFENSITLGALVNLAGMFIVVIGVYYKLTGRVEMHSYRLKLIEETIKNVSIILQNNAITDQRVNSLEKTIEGLKRGEGFIRARATVDGEYAS